MSNFLAIATVTAALRRTLETAVDADVPGASVTTNRPQDPSTGTNGPGVNIYLYQVTPNTAWRNADLPTRRTNGDLIQRPKVALDLHYLFSFYGDETALEPQLLFQDLPQSLKPSWAWLLPATVLTTLFFVWIVAAGLKIQLAGPRTGPHSMIGLNAEVIERVDRAGGRVFVSGEYWNALSDEEIEAGEVCKIEQLDGLTMKVSPIEKSDATPSST